MFTISMRLLFKRCKVIAKCALLLHVVTVLEVLWIIYTVDQWSIFTFGTNMQLGIMSFLLAGIVSRNKWAVIGFLCYLPEIYPYELSWQYCNSFCFGQTALAIFEGLYFLWSFDYVKAF